MEQLPDSLKVIVTSIQFKNILKIYLQSAVIAGCVNCSCCIVCFAAALLITVAAKLVLVGVSLFTESFYFLLLLLLLFLVFLFCRVCLYPSSSI